MFFNLSRFLNSKFSRLLSPTEIEDLKSLTTIFPFKVSRYVLEELIDWDNRDSDPIFRLTFPRREMLSDLHWRMLQSADSPEKKRKVIAQIRRYLNPHPDGQKDNIPRINGRELGGIQHKYDETVLFFAAQAQSCHSYCTYCFRWAQFVNAQDHKFSSKEHQDLFDYLDAHKEVTDILLTGGDPMWMDNATLFSYLDVLNQPELDHVTSIRIGSKALSFFPQKFLGADGDELLDKFATLRHDGKNITLMAHISHPRELSTKKVKQAVNRLRNAGVTIRTQAPLIRGINDSAQAWMDMWKESVQMGMIPYYMFVERDTGAHEYFSVPLAEAYEIFTEAYAKVSGLAKTVRGPSMSAWPGKVLVCGMTEDGNNKKFVLKFIQARNPELTNKPFLADFDPDATWLSDLNIDYPMREKIEQMRQNYTPEPLEEMEVA